ncbi:cation:proton antiporter (plasmid) [Rhizobium leguminosarum]
MQQMPDTAIFLAQAATIVGGPYLLWHHLRLKSFAPLVVTQIFCGILLGPAGMGLLLPELWENVFSKTSVTALSGLAWMAVVLFSFLSGLHLDPLQLRSARAGPIYISLGSALVPAFLGTVAGMVILTIYPDELGPSGSAWQFALAVGICLGVTALPVLAAILREMGLIDSRLGSQALICAAIVDALMQVMLLLLVLTVNRRTAPWDLIVMLLLAVCYFAGMILIVRPLLARCLRTEGPLSETGTVLVVSTAIMSAFVTDVIGFHYIIGAFAAGAIMPGVARRAIFDRLETVILVALLPFFFMLAGLKTSVSAVSPAFFGMFLIVCSVAVFGKIIGTALPARYLGDDWPHATALGILMQSKGLMEVVFLTVFFDLGIIRSDLFAALLLTALLTTAITKPLLSLIAVRTGMRTSAP